jgi:hypothetical protein
LILIKAVYACFENIKKVLIHLTAKKSKQQNNKKLRLKEEKPSMSTLSICRNVNGGI